MEISLHVLEGRICELEVFAGGRVLVPLADVSVLTDIDVA